MVPGTGRYITDWIGALKVKSMPGRRKKKTSPATPKVIAASLSKEHGWSLQRAEGYLHGCDDRSLGLRPDPSVKADYSRQYVLGYEDGIRPPPKEETPEEQYFREDAEAFRQAGAAWAADVVLGAGTEDEQEIRDMATGFADQCELTGRRRAAYILGFVTKFNELMGV